jgi:hypothetical protein
LVIKAQVFAQSETESRVSGRYYNVLLGVIISTARALVLEGCNNKLSRSAISPSAASTCHQVYLAARAGGRRTPIIRIHVAAGIISPANLNTLSLSHTIHACTGAHKQPRASVYLCTHVCALQTNTHLEPAGCVSSSILCEMCALSAYPMAS